MGRGLIISGGIEGQYQVQLQYDRSRAEAQIASLATELDVIPARLEDLQAEINSTTLDLDYATEVQRAKITAYQADPSGANSTALNEATTALRAETNKLQTFKQSQRLLRLRQTSTQKQIDFLNAALPPDIEVAAWCADYNEQLSGAVGLIESGLVEGPQYIIRPAGENGDLAAYNAASDGQITPLLSMSAAAAFLNYARLPGQAKWRPRYRLGTITSLDPGAANCNLNLDSANSTHQQLGINQSVSLSAVPISYMMCNAAAFTVGDRVVIEFIAQDWSQPQVIGFVDHPRACGLTLVGPQLDPESGTTYTAKNGIAPYDWYVSNGLVILSGGGAQDTTITIAGTRGAATGGTQELKVYDSTAAWDKKIFVLSALDEDGSVTSPPIIHGPTSLPCGGIGPWTYTISGGIGPYWVSTQYTGLEMASPAGSSFQVQPRNGDPIAGCSSGYMNCGDSDGRDGGSVMIKMGAGGDCYGNCYYSIYRDLVADGCDLVPEWEGVKYPRLSFPGYNSVKIVGTDVTVTGYITTQDVGSPGCSQGVTWGDPPSAEVNAALNALNALSKEERIAAELVPQYNDHAPDNYPWLAPFILIKRSVSYCLVCPD